jgi:hypothetical protein
VNDPSRLLDRGASDDELRLLLAGAAEEPPADGLAKLAASLNVVLAPAMANAAKLGAPSPWRSLTSKLAAKWVAVTLATTGVVAGALLAHRGSSPHGVGKHESAADTVQGNTAATLADDVHDAPQNEGDPAHATLQNGSNPTSATSQNGIVAGGVTSQNVSNPTSATSQNDSAAGVATSQGGRGTNPAVSARTTTHAERTVAATRPARAAAEPAAVTGVSSTTPSVPTTVSHDEPSATQSIAGEIAALDGVRVRLTGSDGEGALRALDEYRRDYPEGALGQEATLLRIDALVASGNVARARSTAERFLRDHPGTPHEKRLRTLIGGS